MFEDLSRLREGIQVGDMILYSGGKKNGRIAGQYYTELLLKFNGEEKRLSHMSVYKGKLPYYTPWIELFGLKGEIHFSDTEIYYFDSKLEMKLLDILSGYLGPGGKLFVEYYEDKETSYGLLREFPVPLTRLGYEMFVRGFTWFKDWYFPEGFNEGGEKLQGEKPIDEEHRDKHLKGIKKGVDSFKERWKDADNQYVIKALKRAEEIETNYP